MAKSILDQLRARFQAGTPAEVPTSKVKVADMMQAGGGRFPALTMRAVPVNPYKPNVEKGDFPDVRLPMGRWTPPSIHPQMIIRNGPIPNPTGRTVPLGAIHTPGPVKVTR